MTAGKLFLESLLKEVICSLMKQCYKAIPLGIDLIHLVEEQKHLTLLLLISPLTYDETYIMQEVGCIRGLNRLG